MRVVSVVVVVAAVFTSAGCQQGAANVCDLSTELPSEEEVGLGRGRADRSDGGELNEPNSTWKPASAITIGTLTINGNTDEAGLDVDDLISAGTFPICQRLGARDERTASADLAAENVRTDATHTGSLSILGLEDDVLIGRFQVDLAGGGNELSLDNGAFRLTRRP